MPEEMQSLEEKEAALLDLLAKLEAEDEAVKNYDAQLQAAAARLTPFAKPPAPDEPQMPDPEPVASGSSPFASPTFEPPTEEWTLANAQRSAMEKVLAGVKTRWQQESGGGEAAAGGDVIPPGTFDDTLDVDTITPEITRLRGKIEEIAYRINGYRQEASDLLPFFQSALGDGWSSKIENSSLATAGTTIFDHNDVAEINFRKSKTEINLTTLESLKKLLIDIEGNCMFAISEIRAKKAELETKPDAGDTEREARETDTAVRERIRGLKNTLGPLITLGHASLMKAKRLEMTDGLTKLNSAAFDSVTLLNSINSELQAALNRTDLLGKNWHTTINDYTIAIRKESKNVRELKSYVDTHARPDGDAETPDDEKEKTEKKDDNLELQKLKIAYEKAKKEYNAFFGAVKFFKSFTKKGKKDNTKATENLQTAKENYETKLADYTEKYIEETLRDRIDAINASVEDRQDKREKNIFYNITKHYKKTGLQRLALGAGLLGLSALIGFDTSVSQNIASWIRRPLSGVAAGFGVYSLLTGAIRLGREKAGILRDLKQEKIDAMEGKELILFLAARELDAQQRNTDIKTDGVYIALLERLQTLQADAIEGSLEKKLEEVDKKRKWMGGMSKAETGLLLTVSAVVTAVTGTGLIFQAGDEIKKAAKAIAEHSASVNTARSKIAYARELIAGAHTAAEESAKSAAQTAHLTADQTKDLIKNATSTAEAKVKELWHAAYDHGEPLDGVKTEGIPDSAAAAAQKTIDEAIKAAQQLKDAPIKAVSMSELARQLVDAPDANNDPALQEALDKIVEHKIVNKESASIISVAKEYARIWNEHHKSIQELASTITTNNGKLPDGYKISLTEFETLRDIASWHGTPLGDAANKVWHLIDKPILDASNIHQIDITPGTTTGQPHTLYEAFTAAEHQMGVKGGAQINKDYLTFLNEHLPKNKQFDFDHLKEAKRIVHQGEHLWVSGNDIVLSQDHELLANADTDLGPDEATPQTHAETHAEKPDKPAHTAEHPPKHDAPAAKAVAQHAPASKPEGTPAPTHSPTPTPDATKNIEVKLPPDSQLIERDALFTDASLVTELQRLRSLEQVSPQIISDCHVRPHGLAQFLVDPQSTLYPDLKFDLVIAAARDMKNHANNIREILGGFFASERPTLKLTIGDKLVTIPPTK